MIRAIGECSSEASKESDLILISAGSSTGRKDYTVKILDKLGEVLIHGVAIRPGKPVILAVIGSTPVVGLPGYPVAAYVALELLLNLFSITGRNRPPDKPFWKPTVPAAYLFFEGRGSFTVKSGKSGG